MRSSGVPSERVLRHASSNVYVPRTFESHVDSGERLAMPTIVWAARWNTALTLYSLRIRSTAS